MEEWTTKALESSLDGERFLEAMKEQIEEKQKEGRKKKKNQKRGERRKRGPKDQDGEQGPPKRRRKEGAGGTAQPAGAENGKQRGVASSPSTARQRKEPAE